MMAAYGRQYDELTDMPYSRFEDLWKSYSTRVALDKLDQEVARQRSVIQGAAMAESRDIELALEDLEARAAQAKRLILDPELLHREDPDPEPSVATSAWGQFRTDKWWEHPVKVAADEVTPVHDDQVRSEDDLGLSMEDTGRNRLDLTDVVEWEDQA